MSDTLTQALLFLATHPSEHLDKGNSTYYDVPVVPVSKNAPPNTGNCITVDPQAIIRIEPKHISVTYITVDLDEGGFIAHKFEEDYLGNRTSRFALSPCTTNHTQS